MLRSLKHPIEEKWDCITRYVMICLLFVVRKVELIDG